MGRLRIATTECNYKEINRQLKEQFIHGLNGSNLSIEIIQDLTEVDTNENLTSDQCWHGQGEVKPRKHNQPS